MYLFHNDYNEVCHPAILKKIEATRAMQMPGYGMDLACMHATKLIKQKCENDSVDVHFLVGGTQTNLIVTAAALRPHQAVLCAVSGHVNCHETGAIEATGHKVVTLPSEDGKITAEQVASVAFKQANDDIAEHNVQVKMVYISNSTEYGTIYTLEELRQLSAVCKQYGLYLFVDGARLGYALTAQGNDVTLRDLSQLCDVFYIGGTKCGAMFGEAVIISNKEIAKDFRYIIKQRGAMLAKGWLLGQQFETLFENDLYFEISSHANRQADKLRDVISGLGYQLIPGCTNQVFAVLPKKLLTKLSDDFTFMIDKDVDGQNSLVRFCTSWATTEQSVDALCRAIREFSELGKEA